MSKEILVKCSLYLLSFKFPTSCCLLWLYSPDGITSARITYFRFVTIHIFTTFREFIPGFEQLAIDGNDLFKLLPDRYLHPLALYGFHLCWLMSQVGCLLDHAENILL